MNYFKLSAGMNSSGIASAGGVGNALAEWMIKGTSTRDLWGVDVRRFAKFHGNIDFLKARTVESLGLHYKMPWPGRELETGQCDLACCLLGVHGAGSWCRSAVAAVAAVPEAAGEGCALWQPDGVGAAHSLWRRAKHLLMGQTQLVCRAASRAPPYAGAAPANRTCTTHQPIELHRLWQASASIFDQTSFSKFLIQGNGALAAMQARRHSVPPTEASLRPTVALYSNCAPTTWIPRPVLLHTRGC
jgi:hypothetical protein